MIFQMSPHACATLAREVFSKDTGYSNKTDKALDKEICESLIGTTYEVCSELWNLINPSEREELRGSHPKHLFWALLFLKCYCTEPILTRVVGGVDAKTFRNWTWLFVGAITSLKPRVIEWTSRFKNWDGTAVCLISVDGIDCATQEPYPFEKAIFSEKLNGPGYKYEIGVSIRNADIVWVNGPFKAGRHDKRVFTDDGLKDALIDGECVEVDRGYKGDAKFKNPDIAQSREDRRQKGKVLARHENVNGKLKKFAVLDDVFRHNSMAKHEICFNAVAVITQLRFQLNGRLYGVEYNVQYD